MAKKVTMKQLADKLEVSINTISLVLNDRPGVSEEMRRRVLREANASGYLEQTERYNKAVSSKTICILTRKAYFNDMYFYGKVLYGIQTEASRLGYETLLHVIDESGRLPDCITRGRVSGVILVGEFDKSAIPALRSSGLPLVFTDSTPYDQPSDSVLTDNGMGAFRAVEYLAACGHRKIGFFGDVDYSLSIKERYWGYIQAIHKCMGFAEMPDTFRYALRYSLLKEIEAAVISQDTQSVVAKLKGMPELPEAFLCSNDRAAVLLSNALHSLGHRLPDDVSIIGFDDMDLCTMTVPRLTTMHVAKKRMGSRAARLLIWRIANSRAPVEKVLLPVELVVRDSVKRREPAAQETKEK